MFITFICMTSIDAKAQKFFLMYISNKTRLNKTIINKMLLPMHNGRWP